jgi:hypothetical protein
MEIHGGTSRKVHAWGQWLSPGARELRIALIEPSPDVLCCSVRECLEQRGPPATTRDAIAKLLTRDEALKMVVPYFNERLVRSCRGESNLDFAGVARISRTARSR